LSLYGLRPVVVATTSGGGRQRTSAEPQQSEIGRRISYSKTTPSYPARIARIPRRGRHRAPALQVHLQRFTSRRSSAGEPLSSTTCLAHRRHPMPIELRSRLLYGSSAVGDPATHVQRRAAGYSNW